MSTLKNSTDRLYILFIGFVSVILLLGIGSYGLAETSEARYAEIAREMFLSGDYLNPKLLGVFHFHKPPITYQITALGYMIFGINEFGARFFIQIAISLQLVLVYGMARLLLNDRKVAFLSGVIYFSMPMVLISSRNLTTDAYLTTFIIASIFCWQYYTSKGKKLFLYLFYACVGLALLTKGPVALLFIIIYIITYKLIFKKSFLINYHHFIGFILCVLIGASWYMMVILKNPQLWDYFLNKQLVSRMAKDSFNRSKPFWFYMPIILGLLFPWIIAIIPGFKNKIKSIFKLSKVQQTLLMASLLLVLVFSFFSTKLIFYILPVFWMLALFIASQLHTITIGIRKIIDWTYVLLTLILVIVLLIFKFFPVDDMVISKWNLCTSFFAVLSAIFVNQVVKTHKIYKPVLMGFIFGLSLILVSNPFFKNNSAIINSTKDIVAFIDGTAASEPKTILVYDYLLPSIAFYSTDKLITIKFDHNTTNRETQFENDATWSKGLWNAKTKKVVADLDSLSRTSGTFMLVRKKKDLDKNLSFLKVNFKHQKNFSKYYLYYNK